MNCPETPYMQYIEVPITNPNQILDGFFKTETTQASSTEENAKANFEDDKVVMLLIIQQY